MTCDRQDRNKDHHDIVQPELYVCFAGNTAYKGLGYNGESKNLTLRGETVSDQSVLEPIPTKRRKLTSQK